MFRLEIFIALLLITLSFSSFKNTTAFFNKQIGYNLTFQSFSGYEDVDWYFPKGSASMYYSIFQGHSERWNDSSVPLIIWLQGGPGGASQFGCFNEIGPLFIQNRNGTNKIIQNPWSWNFYGHVMCVDQPLGVGFSTNVGNKKVDNTPDASKHFINFLSNFFKNSPWNLSSNPLYLAGQSYAGHYIPQFADKITANTSLNFKLAGILIGDGYVDPQYQINNYDSYLYSVGVVSKEWRDTTAFMQNQALIRIMNSDYQDACNYTNFMIADDSVSQKYYNGMNVLNYKQYDDGNININYAKYLQAQKSQFGVPDSAHFVDDNQQMYYAFCDDFSRSFKPQLQRVLNRGVRTLIYNGQNDFIVNTAGVLNYMNTLEWTYAKQWRQAKKTIWKDFGNQNLGWTKNYGNLMFTLVRDAGHLLPSDQPRAAWLMLGKYFQR